ncbi:MAG: hypothetical protein ACE361_21375 [Aureliella sp.]
MGSTTANQFEQIGALAWYGLRRVAGKGSAYDVLLDYAVYDRVVDRAMVAFLIPLPP